jgi:protein-tyrosine phosphatase
MGLDLATAGLDWLHLPVPDFGVPGDAAGWDAAQDRIGRLLAGGGRVLVHCRAGLGRSGAVLLRLMVAAGEGPEPALARLRSVRPGAVETDAQRRWAEGQGGTRNTI